VNGTRTQYANFLCVDNVKEIFSLHIPHGMEDTVVWNFDKKALFSVKLAYQLDVKLRDN
jgi:hypothetical protein